MLTLRLTETREGPEAYRVEATLEGERLPRQMAVSKLEFSFTDQDQEQLRWYLEDYLQRPGDPAPEVAHRVERRMSEIGAALFDAIFAAGDARDLWAGIRPRLAEVRVEVITGVEEAVSIPWELIRDTKTDTVLALAASAFVRAHPRAAVAPVLPAPDSGPVRILLVICRPGGEQDVPFRSVANRLVKGLGRASRHDFRLDVLRPPDFAGLARVLREASHRREPYHVVHFDGHGLYGDLVAGPLPRLVSSDASVFLSPPRPGAHGYVAFENPAIDANLQLVDGPALGALLVETSVPVLVLNACRSAHAEPISAPAGEGDPHERVRAYGTLAQEIMDMGVGGVVAMRYNVYVVTAAQFMADVYAELVAGRTLGEAVTLARKQLAAQPLRDIAFEPLPLQDWVVPVVYEAAPLALASVTSNHRMSITVRPGDAAVGRGSIDPKLPKPPDAGFFGRDETLFALDRAFDTDQVVLLCGLAGAGKTSTAAEFARWYALTGGVKGAVVFTSFNRYLPLANALDQLAAVLDSPLREAGIDWARRSDSERREIALQLLAQVPVLWLWDNVEPIAGFPTGSQSPWSPTEQQDLADFLRDASGGVAKFLLTSRRKEQVLLGDLPRRILTPPMPLQERFQLARALAAKRGRRLTGVEDWYPLLTYTGGNPLTITVVVRQALREGLQTRAEVEEFVARLRSGEGALPDDEQEGRSRSLSASLSYGFQTAFSEQELAQLALLHFFQGFVGADAFRLMGESKTEWCVPELRGLTRDATIALLDRAEEVGLLTARGGGYYEVHPVLPWYSKALFDRHYPATSQAGKTSPAIRAARAFVEATAHWSRESARTYRQQQRRVVAVLAAGEDNLLHAWRLGRANRWWEAVIGIMQGLDCLYEHRARWTELARIVEAVRPELADPAIERPLPGLEEEWALLGVVRVALLMRARQWADAERLLRSVVDVVRTRAGRALAEPPGTLPSRERNDVHSLQVVLMKIGEVQRSQGRAECIRSFEEAMGLAGWVEDREVEGILAFNLGVAYLDVLEDLDQAELWLGRSLELREENDQRGRAASFGRLGAVASRRFERAAQEGRPEEETLGYLNTALASYQLALSHTPPDAVSELAIVHNQLGIVDHWGLERDRALWHFREAIRYEELVGHWYGAAETQRNVAILFMDSSKYLDALEWAQAAYRNFEKAGQADADIAKTTQLIAAIEKRLAETAR